MQQVDEQDAPTGFYAAHSPDGSCNGGAFQFLDAFSCGSYPCAASKRVDGYDVVYKPDEFRKLREAEDVIRRVRNGCSIHECFYEAVTSEASND